MTGSAAAATRIERIGEAVRAHRSTLAARDEPYWDSAVSIVLRGAERGPEILFVQRAVRADDPWSGQIGLPGGRRDAAESDLLETAIRETREETAIDLRTEARLFGALDEMRPRNPALPPFIVRPYVATLTVDPRIVISDELAGYFWAPMDAIFDPSNTRPAQVTGRGVTMWREAIHVDGHVIWGLTERILRAFASTIR